MQVDEAQKLVEDIILEAMERAFVAGAAWWEYHKEGATMWESDQRLAGAEARKRIVEARRNDEPYFPTLEQRIEAGTVPAGAIDVGETAKKIAENTARETHDG